jgi:hypothetical protein
MTATVLTLPGVFGSHDVMALFCNGTITAGKDLVPIEYNNFTLDYSAIEQGADMLDTALHDFASTGVLAFGHSDGARVINLWLATYGLTSTLSPSEASFLMMGDSVNKIGGALYDAAANNTVPDATPYTVTNFIRQYDGWADFPQDPTVEIAVQNAMVGANTVHTDYYGVAPTDVANRTHVVGHISYIWSPTYPVATAQTPLLLSSYISSIPGLPSLYSSQDQHDRPLIEAGYSRPVAIPPPTY